MTGEIVTLTISKLLRAPALQPRLEGVDGGGLNRDHLNQLFDSEPADWPPIVVRPHGDKYVIVDGHHRVAAAMKLGRKEIAARVVPNADREIAFSLNVIHGLALTREDRKEHALYLRKRHPDWSERQIARACGLSQATVNRHLKPSESTSQSGGLVGQAKESQASRSIDDVARAVVRGVGKLWDARGLSEMVGGDARIGSKLADALRDVYDDDARGWAKRLESWATQARKLLESARTHE